MNIGYLISFAGLIVDISGGLLLAKAVFSQNPSDIRDATSTHLSGNWSAFRSGLFATVEARFAVVMLLLGFLGQSIGGLVEGTSTQVVTDKAGWIWAIGILSLCFVGALLLWCHYLTTLWNDDIQLIQELGSYNAGDAGADVLIARANKRVLLDRQAGESDADLIMRYNIALRKMRKLL